MSDVKEMLERARATAARSVPQPDEYEVFLRYRDRRRGNQRLAAGAIALALVLAAAGTAFSVLRADDAPRFGVSGVAEVEPPDVGQAVAGFRDDGTPFLVVRHEDGSLTAVEAISPHVAVGGVRKLLGWCASSQTFDDPFHGARFDGYGRYISGPSPKGLVRFDVESIDEDPGFRLGDRLPPLPRSEAGQRPIGPFCMDTEVTPLVMPGSVSLWPADPAVPNTPASLVAILDPEPPFGSRWEIEATLYLTPDGDAFLCAAVEAGVCSDGAPVEGPRIDGGDPLAIPGRWLVLIRDGTFVDPIRAG